MLLVQEGAFDALVKRLSETRSNVFGSEADAIELICAGTTVLSF